MMKQFYDNMQKFDSAKSKIYDEDEWAKMQKIPASKQYSFVVTRQTLQRCAVCRKATSLSSLVQFASTSKLQNTYQECRVISGEVCLRWEMENKRWERHVRELRWDSKFYSSLTWAKKQYSSLKLPLPRQDAKQWIIDNQRRIGWVYNSDETITYYVIRTFVFGVYQNNPHYAMALCNPIKTSSCDSEEYSAHSLVVDDDWMDYADTVHYISLYRLHVGCLAYWHGEKDYVGLSNMTVSLHQFRETHRDYMFKLIRRSVQQGN